jgi:cytochrome c oxidase subunit I+III
LFGVTDHNYCHVLKTTLIRGASALFLQFQLVVVLILMTGFTIAGLIASKLDNVRRATFDNLTLLWHYTVAQGAITIALIDGFPRRVV